MRLRTRFVLLIALAALGPLALLGGVAIKVSTAQVVAKVTEVQARTATALADHVAGWVDLQLRLLARQSRTFDVGALTAQERGGLLRLVYQQNPAVRLVVLVDSAEEDLAPPVYLTRPAAGELSERAVVAPDQLERFRQELSEVRKRTPPGRVGFGEPLLLPDEQAASMVIAARLSGGALLGVVLDLTPLQARFAVPEGSSEQLSLVSGDGRLVMGLGELVLPDVIAGLPDGALADDVRYRTADGTMVLAASAPVEGTGWFVVAAEPLASTSAPARAITARTAYVMGVAALIAVVLGLLVSRQVTDPVLDLRDAAMAVAEGDFGRRVDSKPNNGELTEVAHAFNFMSRKLQQDRKVIAAKNAEIEAFNQELQDRVDERTRQLRDAQEQLVRSARLAAVGEMGAGLAHELNNPLAGVLGLVQVLRMRADAGGATDPEMLASVEEQAQRCSEIVTRMQRYSRVDSGVEPLDREGWAMVDLGDVLEEVLGIVQGSFSDRGVDLSRDLRSGLRVHGDRGAIAQALTQLLASIRAAAGPGARLHVHAHPIEPQVDIDRQPAVASVGQQVLVDLYLSGAPLRVGEDDWRASGLGFWAARQVIGAHGGVLEEPTLPAEGQATEGRWRLRLPGV